MDQQPPGHSKIRKRATKACLACRARKVRCDVSQRGRPCMNCYLDGENCVVIGRASRRRNPKEDEADNSAAAEDEGSTHLQGRNSGELRLGPAQNTDIDALMDSPSEGGSETPDAQRTTGSGFSAINTANGSRKSDTQIPEPNSSVAFAPHAPRHDPPQQPHSSTTARLQQLQWAGEQSMVFGADITYTYYPFLTLDSLSNILPQDVSYLEMQGCLRVPIRAIMDEFVKQFFLHVHPITPLLNEGDVWDMYGSQSSGPSASDKLSLLVLQAMMFSACVYVPRNTIKELGFSDAGAAQAAFYRRAKLLFDFEAESSPIAIAQAALLLSSWDPGPRRHRVHVGSFWLGVSIEQAKLARAHQYWVGPHKPQATKRNNCLKRLWWSIILHDRLLSMFYQRTIQVTPAQFDIENHTLLQYEDLADEQERSRVYNGGIKRSLVQFVEQMIKLAAALTDLLLVLYPLDEVRHWNKRSSNEERARLENCRRKLSIWDTETRGMFRAPISPERSNPLGEITHDSAVLYHDFVYLLYHSAMTRLSHFECLQLIGRSGFVDAEGAFTPDNSTLSEKQRELGEETLAVVSCLGGLVNRRLSRLLPFGSIACATLPLILGVIELQIAPSWRLGESIRVLDASSRSAQNDMVDSMAFAVREIFGLVHREKSPAADEHSHPSVYLRLALSLDPDLRSSSVLGPADCSASIQRLFAPSTAIRVKAILSQRGRPRRKSTTGSPGLNSAGSAIHESSIQQKKMAAWMEQDQAISYGVQLGIVPPDLAREERQEAVLRSDSVEDEGVSSREGSEDVEWKGILDEAFSETGDTLESNLLNAFAACMSGSGVWGLMTEGRTS